VSAGGGFPNSSANDVINDIVEFLVEYYSRFIVEDSLFRELKSRFEEIGKEAEDSGLLQEVIYATSNEPVRLGEFRILFNEVYKRVHGSLLSRNFDLALHGVMREDLKVLLSIGLKIAESYHVGIDYASLIEYPAPDKSRKVIVPLFIIAKSKPDDINKIKIREAVEAVTKALPQNGEFKKVIQALRSIPRFTRIILTRTVREVDAPCVIKEHQGIPVYNDIACGIIGPVFKDIPGMYDEIAANNELANLTIRDWISVLISLAIPIVRVDIATASSPPQPPREGGPPGEGGTTIENIVRQIRQMYEKALSKAAEVFEKEAGIDTESQAREIAEKKISRNVNEHTMREHRKMRAMYI